MKKIQVSHTLFSVLFITVLLLAHNVINYDKTTQWFLVGGGLDYLGLIAFYVFCLSGSIAIFLLFAHRFTTKPLAIAFIILSATATYFIEKYNVAIDRSMVVNALHTDITEVRALLSVYMLPHLILLIILPLFILSRIQIVFQPCKRHLLQFFLVFTMAVGIAGGTLYVQHNSLIRAVNTSKQHVFHTLVPVNVIAAITGAINHRIKPYFEKQKKPIPITGEMTLQQDLLVVLAIGEGARQKNFNLYGYTGNNTNPRLSRYGDLQALNGIATRASTIYALPKILEKNDVKLTAITSALGVQTSCLVNFTMYDNCYPVDEIEVNNCGHGGKCYDEDVVTLLDEVIEQYQSGYRFAILHLGGGSHGPIYQTRYPKTFQVFNPQCFEANVMNHCTEEELYNAYDNSILYLDYVLDKILLSLEQSNKPYILIYLSDHGESLMEEGRIFHGLPPGLQLPDEQAQIPLLIHSSIPITIVPREQYHQQDVFDTVLSLFSIKTPLIPHTNSFIKKIY